MTARSTCRRHPSIPLLCAGWAARIASMLCVPLLLVGCGGHGTDPSLSDADGTRIIPCGPRAGEPRQSCTLAVEDRGGTLTLTLRQPDGGFRRLTWPRGGTLASADGAEQLETTALNGGGIEVRIGDWRYRIEKKGGGLP